MFDTMQVGRRIRQARIEKNMTQMALADAMGVSYQAVSNWERGNSMPDISKLPELCELLGVTFEKLAGGPSREAETLEKVLEGAPVTPEEAVQVASLLPPETVKESAEQAQKEAGIDFETLMSLAPFLDEGYLDELAQELAVSDLNQVVALAPFLHERTVIALAHKAAAEDMSVLFALAPFVDERTMDELALSLKEKGPVDRAMLSGLAPFLSQKTLLALLR
ncbi:MAG: helix-turn-helix transcriptional regulator [Clostridia bacterium]|nr:helix-turn-helix transcriptional regulator [Clostridia bacterium]MBQ6359330.1 helix-turn-helix transcriptional regulator [Clostridia bacterium]MBQ9923695.1 helix-turn-helix transcriptional regulator [Clostridia bacterium]